MVKTRKKRQKGGRVSLKFDKPEVSNTSASGAIQQTMHKQAESNKEVSQLNKDFGQGGGGEEEVVVPQMSQAGAAGNDTITSGIGKMLQGRADGELDNPSYETKPSGMPGGGRKRRRRRRKTKRKSRKSKKRRRKKRKTRKRRKSRRKR